MPLLLPALTVPSRSKTGASLASEAAVTPARGCSSRASSAMGTISSAKRPSAQAASQRFWLRAAKVSCSSREIPYWRARVSAVSPMILPDIGSRNPSWTMASTIGRSPILVPQRASSRYGTRLIDSAPRASTTSASPRRIERHAARMACIPERHAWLIV